MKPGTKIVSVAALPELQTAIKDFDGNKTLAVLFWIVSYGIRSQARRAQVGYRYLFMHPSGLELAELAELIEREKLRVVVDKTYPFADIVEALAYVVGERAKGKVAVRMG